MSSTAASHSAVSPDLVARSSKLLASFPTYEQHVLKVICQMPVEALEPEVFDKARDARAVLEEGLTGLGQTR